MPNLDRELAYFRISIGQAYAAELSQSQPIPPGAIRKEVENGPFGLNAEQREEIIRNLESAFTTTQKRGSAITDSYKPWLASRKADIDFYYWDRLRRYYLEGDVLPPQVIATLDFVTDEILDYLGNPSDEASWSRRGMAMGHVQSGKTTNYSALICKAADAGYKVIILLAGITNSLRSQTQERLDETFIGRKSVFHATAREALPIVNYASTRRFPGYGTSRDRDFTRDAAGVVFNLNAHSEPVIFVTKKNKSPLESLHRWLSEQLHGQKLTAPLLLIDDEADNASINTLENPGATTAINGAIRKILGFFDRSSYVGYTATPFANIFIDPDNDQQMLADDLFPSHFIKALDPPSTYVGAERVFSERGDLRKRMVVIVDDYDKTLPLKHKRDLELKALPDSLYEAIRVFVLTRAIRVLRGDGKNHCSMMINVSRFNDVQAGVLGLVYEYLQEIKNALVVHGGRQQESIRSETIQSLRESFESQLSDSGHSFAEVLGASSDAARSIEVLTVNMKGGNLDYQKNKEHGLHVIAIGGLALSRGLTLEGLTVSYILRNTAASDTLMQMARWFGYRPGYEDLCRVYLPKVSLEHYENIHEAIEELRAEVRRMQLAGLTPREFGLRVRQSPTAIKITAANKMRTATSLTVAQDYSCRHIEGHALLNDNDINRENLALVRDLVSELSDGNESSKGMSWKEVDGKRIVNLSRKFRFADSHPDLARIAGDSSLLSDYIADRLGEDTKSWDVAIPFSSTGELSKEFLQNREVRLRRREVGDIFPVGIYRITGAKNRVADPSDAELLLDKEELDRAKKLKSDESLRGDRVFCAVRSRPLLIVHAFTNSKRDDLQIKGPIVSLSFCLPATNVRSQARTYQVNKVYQQQMRALLDEPDDDEARVQSGDA